MNWVFMNLIRRMLLLTGLALCMLACTVTSNVSTTDVSPTASRSVSATPLRVTSAPYSAFVAAQGADSDNWSGYVVQGRTGTATSVSATWIVPSVLCSSQNTYSAIWVGIDGTTDKTVEQVGTEQDCEDGRSFYGAWVELYPRPSRDVTNLNVSPGDTVSVSVGYDGQFTLMIVDETTGQQYQVTRAVPGAKRQSAEWIVEAPYSKGILALANFGIVHITQAEATFKSQTAALGDLPHSALIMVRKDGTVKAQTSTLTPDGKGFTVVWMAS
jgi:hypothetical protein